MGRVSPILEALYEWTLVVAPVATYVGVEHLFVVSKAAFGYFCSAEWGIATTFLSVLSAVTLLHEVFDFQHERWAVRTSLAKLLGLTAALTIVPALLVSVKISLLLENEHTDLAQCLSAWFYAQWGLFILASALFLWAKSMVCRSAGLAK